MSLKFRITLLLGLLLLGFGAALLVVRGFELRAAGREVGVERETRAQLLNHWLDVTAKALPEFVADAAQSQKFSALIADATPENRKTVEAALAKAELTGLWLLRPDGNVRLHFGRPSVFPVPPADFVAMVAETPKPRFFLEDASGDVFEVAVRKLHSDDAAGADWVAAARVWDSGQVEKLSRLLDAQVSVVPVQETLPTTGNDHIVLLRPLPDWNGRPIRQLRVEAMVAHSEVVTQQTRVLFIFGLLVLAAMVIAVERWVLSPLGRITKSLATDNPKAVSELSRENSELGRVAQLVQASFAQRARLEEEIVERKRTQTALEKSEQELRDNMEERVRLGRDLHDGVIQSLYAAGMGLAGIRPLLNREQTEAAARLEQTRAALNETIHDVRNFIVGLEPEALKSQTFAQAVHGLLEVMQAIRPVRTQVTVDESLAARLTLSQRVHALQIAREAVSNALRHSNATEVRITLQAEGHFAEFQIADDGHGFDVTAAGPGRGLANFVQRARELGGELAVDSAPGRGTTVTLVFSFHPS